jgi:hypothetical protein
MNSLIEVVLDLLRTGLRALLSLIASIPVVGPALAGLIEGLTL